LEEEEEEEGRQLARRRDRLRAILFPVTFRAIV